MMSERILIINTSPRRSGNNAMLCAAVATGAETAGKTVRQIQLEDYELDPCKACMYCEKNWGKCSQSDAWKVIFDLFDWCDAVIFATPVYYYSVSAQLKTLFDRCYMRNSKREFGFQKAAFMAVSAAKSESATDTAYACFKGWLRCVGEVEEAGTVFAHGYKLAGDITGSPELKKAVELGRNI